MNFFEVIANVIGILGGLYVTVIIFDGIFDLVCSIRKRVMK